MNNQKIANINVRIKGFFTRFLEFTYPMHKLNGRQQRVLSLLLYHHHVLKSQITNNKILWKQVFDYDTKVEIYTELGIQSGALENILSQLRKKNVIVDNVISPVYIPILDNKSNKFSMVFNFNIIDEGTTKNS